jgi:hypothetical protein
VRSCALKRYLGDGQIMIHAAMGVSSPQANSSVAG